jgi:hypothetical protein
MQRRDFVAAGFSCKGQRALFNAPDTTRSIGISPGEKW